MKNNRHDPLSPFTIAATAEMARSSLRNAFKITGESDAQIIRAALDQLPENDFLRSYTNLVLLRWVTILLDYLPADHPEFRELYKSWYDAKARTREVI